MNQTQITIEIVKGGFLLTYPGQQPVADGMSLPIGYPTWEREVFTSPRKLNQKIKELLEASGSPAEKDAE